MLQWVGAVLAVFSQVSANEMWASGDEHEELARTRTESVDRGALAVRPVGSHEPSYWAANQEHGMSVTFTDSSVDVACDRDGVGPWTWGMKLVAYGRGARAVPVPNGELSMSGARVEYRRPDVIEWYVNEPRGLKQGFTLLQPPFEGAPTALDTPLFLELQLRGELAIERTDDGFVFRDPQHGRGLAYSELVAWDASGRSLATRMELAGDRVRLVVHDDQAEWPLTVDPLIAKEQAKLTASDAVEYDYFAYSVSLSGDTALVGAPLDDDFGNQSGSAYVFVREGTTWNEQAKLKARDGGPFYSFGAAVALCGDTALVSSTVDIVYVFVRKDTEWNEQARLEIGPSERFARVALSGDTAVIGSDTGGAGEVYVFVRDGTTWSEQAILVDGDGGRNYRFGASLSMFGDSVLIGAPNADGGAPSSGAAYLFTRVGTAWVREAKLGSSDGALADEFGLSVSLSRDFALVGAPFADVSAPNSGSAYVFRRAGSAWFEEAKLKVSDPRIDDNFGSATALARGVAIVGAARGGGPVDTGAAHLYERRGTTWSEVLTLVASDAADHTDRFGADLSHSEGSVLIGAHGNDDWTGAAYVFLLGSVESYCTAKTNSLGCLPQIDSTGYPSATAASGFTLVGTSFRNQSAGLALYGLSGPAGTPYQGGLLCVHPPLCRTPASSSNGHPPPIRDCSGQYRIDLNAFAAGLAGGQPRPELRIPGTEVHCQWWARDADDPFGSSLSNGLAFTVGP